MMDVGTLVGMTFYPHEQVFTDSPIKLLSLIGIVVTLATILASAVTWYRHSRCQQSDCRNRLGLRRHRKYPYGHLKLCHVHHPLVPNDGQITAAHVDAVTQRLGS